MNREAIFAHIDANLDAHVAHIQSWVRQPSVSWDDMGVADCAALVANSYRALGCQQVELPEGRFYPGVFAEYDAGAPLTVHNYCMFDTRTVRPEEWRYDPWGAELIAQGPYPKVLMGRGSMGAKGPYVAWLNALSSIIAVEGTLPINVVFLAEGEEILGSPSYRDFVERYRDRLARVNASFCPASTQNAAGSVSVGLGLKGMIVVELTATGAAWGYGPGHTVHSATGGLLDSPPFRLASALATLVEPDGRGCAVEGMGEWWTYRKPLEAEEQALLDKLAARAEGKDWRDVLPLGGPANAPSIRGGMEGMEPLVNYLYGPTFNIAGLRSGFLGRKSATIPFIVPSEATAMLDMRMVIDAEPEAVIQALRRHLDARGFSDIRIDTYAAFSHSQTSLQALVVQAGLQTLAQWGIEPVVWPIEAGGGPWTVVPNAFNVPCLRGAAIGGGGRGNADEYMVIEGDGKVAGLADVEKYYVDLVLNYAATASATT
jgi:acetylornithine deacetylase/succinyl-diaminopimelate desuccinylase-like protein